MSEIDILFEEKNLVKLIDYSELLPGINIFTLFDDNDRPILERMVFNHRGIERLKAGTPSYFKNKDSILINVPLKNAFKTSKCRYFS